MKCSFSVEEGIFSRHLITKQRIKANPLRVKAISKLQPPKSVDEIQNLTAQVEEWSNGQKSRRSLSKNERVHSTTNGNRPSQRRNLGDKEIEVEETKRKEPEPENAWKLFTDRASSSDGSGAGLMLVNPKGKEYTYALIFEFETTNNEAEYEALLAGLRIATKMKIQELAIFVDSQLVANQVKGLFQSKTARHKAIPWKNKGDTTRFPQLLNRAHQKGLKQDGRRP
ncbi:reverse transcriptase domain-containing protein [Tanacetum coccineum]